MNNIRIVKHLLLFSLLLLWTACRPLEAQLLEIQEVLNGTTTTSDPFINNGLDDAFDGYGAIFNFADLTLNRQVNTIQSIRSYRFIDTFTNNTTDPIQTSLFYLGNLGSDTNTVIVEEGPFRAITFQDAFAPFDSPSGDFDALIAFTTGNNQFATDFVTGDLFANGFIFSCDVSLEPGQSIGLMHFATLIKDAVDREEDLAIATSFSDELLKDPYTVGLTPAQVQSVANFDLILRGDINCDGEVNLLDVAPFVTELANGEFSEKADMNQDGQVDLLDIDGFVFALSAT